MRRNSVLTNGVLAKYLRKMSPAKEVFNIRGHLKVTEHFEGGGSSVVYDAKNLIVNQGKGYLMDLLAETGFTPSYTLSPFSAIVLTGKQDAPTLNDTFADSVYGGTDYLTSEGVLHIPAWTSVTHAEGALTIQLSGTLTQQYGNSSPNTISSVCVCAGTNGTTGGPGEAAYTVSGNEKLWSRVSFGSGGGIVKDSSKSLTFEWLFTIQ